MSQKIATLILVLITAAWGSSFILMKNVAADVSPMAFLTLRFGLAAVILCLLFFKRLRQFTKKLCGLSFVLALMLCTYMLFQIIGLKYTSASNSGFITSLSVLIVPLLSKFFLKKPPTKSNYTGVVLALVGLVFITGVYQGFTALNIGDFYTFLCAVCVAVHLGLADRFTHSNDELLLGIGQIIFSALLSFVVWLVVEPRTFAAVDFNPTLLTSVILTAVFCTAFAFTGQVVMQKHVAPARIALIFTLEPVFAYLYALFIPGPAGVTEALTWPKLLGCVLVVSGMMVSESGIMDRLFAIGPQTSEEPARKK